MTGKACVLRIHVSSSGGRESAEAWGLRQSAKREPGTGNLLRTATNNRILSDRRGIVKKKFQSENEEAVGGSGQEAGEPEDPLFPVRVPACSRWDIPDGRKTCYFGQVRGMLSAVRERPTFGHDILPPFLYAPAALTMRRYP
jgi:hypothetical protein